MRVVDRGGAGNQGLGFSSRLGRGEDDADQGPGTSWRRRSLRSEGEASACAGWRSFEGNGNELPIANFQFTIINGVMLPPWTLQRLVPLTAWFLQGSAGGRGGGTDCHNGELYTAGAGEKSSRVARLQGGRVGRPFLAQTRISLQIIAGRVML